MSSWLDEQYNSFSLILVCSRAWSSRSGGHHKFHEYHIQIRNAKMGSIGPQTSHDDYPPFPEGIKTAPLVSISLSKLEANNPEESTAFFQASKDLGFFYLDTSDSPLGDHLVSEAEQLLQLQKQFFGRPNEEKEQFAREKIDAFFGYRHGVTKVRNENGELRRNEMYNVSPSIWPCYEAA